MRRISRCRVVLAVAFSTVVGFLGACIDQDDFLGPRGPVRVQVQPAYSSLGAAQSLPITRIRMRALDAQSQALLGEFDDAVTPTAPSWQLDLSVDVGDEPVQVLITVEMMNAADLVEWSGRVGPITVQKGTEPEPVLVQVHRGPLTNLDVTDIAIDQSEVFLAEGDSVTLSATVEGGGATPMVFWGSLDETIATVSAQGVVRALLPTSGVGIVAVAGPHADTIFVGIAQSPAGIAFQPDSLVFASVGETRTLRAYVVDARGDSIPGFGVTVTVADTSVVRWLGGHLFQAVSVGTTSVTATAVGEPLIQRTVSARVPTGGGGPASSCSEAPRTSHTVGTTTSETWTRDGSPHRYSGTFTVDSGAVLTIEPGAIVCGATGAYLYFRNGARLDARGTLAAPILFSAADTTLPWGSIYFEGDPADSSFITHATVEHGGYTSGAIYGYYTHPVVVEDVDVRDARYLAINLNGAGSVLRRVVVRDVRVAYTWAVILYGDGIVARSLAVLNAAGSGLYIGGSGLTLDSVLVSGAGSDGVYLGGTGNAVSNLRVENSGTVGINSGSSGDHLASASNVRVIGSGSYGFRSGIGDLARIAPTAADQDSLLGNGRDTLVVTGGTLRGRTVTLRADVPWLLENTAYVDSASVLLVQPGGYLRGNAYAQLYAYNGGTIDARGTAAQPITFTSDPLSPWYGISLQSSDADTSHFRNALFEYSRSTAVVYAYSGHAAVLDSVRVRQMTYGAVYLGSPGSRLSRSVIDTTHTAGYPAVQLANGAVFEQSVVRGAMGDGVNVAGNDVAMLGGRIENSGGVGLSYSSGYASGPGLPVRIIGSGSFPLRASISALARIYPDAASQDSLLGNAIDTIVIAGGRLVRDTATVRADLPWRMETSMYFDSTSVLRVQPGGAIVAHGGLQIGFGTGSTVQAIGTAAQPVTFTTIDPATFWYGLYLEGTSADTSRIVHGVLSNGGLGGYSTIHAIAAHPVRVDSSRIRNAQYRAIYLGSAGSSLRASTVDTTGIASYPAVELASNTRIEQTTIRGAAGVGLQLSGTGITVVGGRIEGSGGVGIYAAGSQSVAPGSVAPRVTGGLAAPVQIGIQPFTVLFPTTASQDSLLGNAVDTVIITGGTLASDTATVRADLPWRMQSSTYFDSTSVLRVLPGGSIAAYNSIQLAFRTGSTVQAIGTAAQPVTFTTIDPATYWYGLYLEGTPADTSRIVHGVLSNGGVGGYSTIHAIAGHPVRVDSSRIRNAQYRAIYLGSAGSSLRASTVDTTGIASYPAVELASNTRIEQTTIRGAAGVGLQLSGTGITVIGGRIEGSGGVGIYAAGSQSVAAGSVAPRVTGGLASPVQIGIQPFTVLFPTAASQDSLLGNAVDTVIITGGTLVSDTATVRADLPWRVQASAYFDSTSVLRVLPGGSIAAYNSIQLAFRTGSTVQAIGTAAQPVTFTTIDPATYWYGLYLEGTPADTSRIVHGVLSNGGVGGYSTIHAIAGHPIRVDSSRIRNAQYRAVYLGAAGSALRGTVVDTTGIVSYAAVELAADVVVDGLTVRGAAGVGLLYTGFATTPLRLNVYGAGSYAADMVAQAVWRMGDVEDDTISGNAINRVRVRGGTVSSGTHYVRPSVPWHLAGTVSIEGAARLVADAGASIYAESGSLDFRTGGYLEAIGTQALPVLLTSSDGTNRWSGLRFYDTPAGTSVLRHVRVEYVQDGNSGAIYTDPSHVIVIDSSAVVRSTYKALHLTASGSLVRETVVDTTLQPTYTAAYFNNDIALQGLTVRAPAGQGFDYDGAASAPIRLSVLNGGGLAGEATVTTVARIAQVDDDVITGNVANRIRMSGSTLTGLDLIMRPSWQLGMTGVVTIGAGARVIGQPGGSLYADDSYVQFSSGGYMEALGTAAQPVVFSSIDGSNRWNGLRFDGVGADTSRLRHVRVEYVQDGSYGAVRGATGHVLDLDTVVIERSSYTGLHISAGSVAHLTVDSTLSAGYAAVAVAGSTSLFRVRVRGATADGIHVTSPSVSISECEVTGAGAHGIHVNTGQAYTVSVSGCDLFGNVNNAVQNDQPAQGNVIATNNWWGDASGAGGAGGGSGDQISTGVDASSPRTAGPFGHAFPQ